MPELPEVETVRRQLKEVLVGKTIKEVEILNERSFVGARKEILGLKIDDILRKAKVVEIVLDNNLSILIHLKMTGQLIYVPSAKLLVQSAGRVVGGHPTADWVNDLPSKHTRVILTFEDGSKLFFNDVRKFGWMKLVPSAKLLVQGAGSGVVPDVVDEEFTVDYLANVLRRSKRAVKLAILDQTLMGGMGNIYANDALYLAKVRPDKASCDLSHTEAHNLYDAMLEVINLGIECGGASAANYVDTKGMGGTYQNHFLVYKQDGKECKKCGSKILKSKIGGRGTFFCPMCQK